MSKPELRNVSNAVLPWSDGCMTAKIWQKGKRVVVSVPELDIVVMAGPSQRPACDYSAPY